jgi:hypothetical protein
MTTENNNENKTDDVSRFENMADQKRSSLPAEFLSFLKHNKKWWLLPIVIALLLLGVLVFLSGTAVAPLIYPLF